MTLEEVEHMVQDFIKLASPGTGGGFQKEKGQ